MVLIGKMGRWKGNANPWMEGYPRGAEDPSVEAVITNPRPIKEKPAHALERQINRAVNDMLRGMPADQAVGAINFPAFFNAVTTGDKTILPQLAQSVSRLSWKQKIALANAIEHAEGMDALIQARSEMPTGFWASMKNPFGETTPSSALEDFYPKLTLAMLSPEEGLHRPSTYSSSVKAPDQDIKRLVWALNHQKDASAEALVETFKHTVGFQHLQNALYDSGSGYQQYLADIAGELLTVPAEKRPALMTTLTNVLPDDAEQLPFFQHPEAFAKNKTIDLPSFGLNVAKAKQAKTLNTAFTALRSAVADNPQGQVSSDAIAAFDQAAGKILVTALNGNDPALLTVVFDHIDWIQRFDEGEDVLKRLGQSFTDLPQGSEAQEVLHSMLESPHIDAVLRKLDSTKPDMVSLLSAKPSAKQSFWLEGMMDAGSEFLVGAIVGVVSLGAIYHFFASFLSPAEAAPQEAAKTEMPEPEMNQNAPAGFETSPPFDSLQTTA